jgi:predicted NodU family carbamoyl transferase
MSMHILGLSAFYHDSAACLVRDGEVVAAAQEERFTRKKKWWLVPILIVTLALGMLVLLGGTGAAPFIYTLF